MNTVGSLCHNNAQSEKYERKLTSEYKTTDEKVQFQAIREGSSIVKRWKTGYISIRRKRLEAMEDESESLG